MDEAMLKSGQYPNVAILAGTDPAEVMREHGRADGAEVDSREQLEADILAHYKTPEEKLKTVREWLDRQKEITERECHASSTWALQERYKALNRVAELTAERDELREKLRIEREAVEACEGCDKVDELTAERDALKEQINRFNAPKLEENAENDTPKGVLNTIDVQNDTREKLEADAVRLVLRMVDEAYDMGLHEATWRIVPQSVRECVGELLDRQAAITRAECAEGRRCR